MGNLFPPHQEPFYPHIMKGIKEEAERKSLGTQPVSESVGHVTSQAQEEVVVLALV